MNLKESFCVNRRIYIIKGISVMRCVFVRQRDRKKDRWIDIQTDRQIDR